MSDYSLRLPAKVKAVNRANALANEYHPILRAAFAPFVGQKLYKANGDLMQKVKDALPKLPYTVRESIYLYPSDYSLVYVAKTCEMNGEHTCCYHETSFYLGELQQGGMVLKNLNYEYPRNRTDFTVEEVEINRAEVVRAEAILSDANRALGVFGKHDN